MAVGILATVLTMAFGAGGAFSASKPKSGNPGEIVYFESPTDDDEQEIDYSDFPETDRSSFKVRFAGESRSETWSFIGVTMYDILGYVYGEDDDARARVKSLVMRPKTSGDYAAPSVIGSYYLKQSSPVMIVDESDDKDVGAHYSQLPILVPSQVDGNDNGEDIIRLTKNRDLELKAYFTEALKIKIKKKSGPNSKGNYTFSATDVEDANYDWRIYTKDGPTLEEGDGRTFTTTKLSTNPASYYVTVEVTKGEGDEQSFGSDTYSITTKKEDDGKTDDDKKDDGATTGTGGSGTGGSGTGTGTTSGTGSSTYKPPKYTPPKSTVPPVTPSTGATDVDNSGLSQAVAGLRGTGTARAVSGVMLSTPASTPNPAGGGEDGRALEKLAAPLADAANDVFKPIDYPDNGWMLMVAVMFAAFVLGGIKEYRNP